MVDIIMDAKVDTTIPDNRAWRLRRSQFALITGSPLWYNSDYKQPLSSSSLTTLYFRVEKATGTYGYLNGMPSTAGQPVDPLKEFICEVRVY